MLCGNQPHNDERDTEEVSDEIIISRHTFAGKLTRTTDSLRLAKTNGTAGPREWSYGQEGLPPGG